MLAITPEIVATMASAMVSHSPHCPTAGFAASASDEIAGGDDLIDAQVARNGECDHQVEPSTESEG